MHEIKGRIRFHVIQNRMSYEQADILQYYFSMGKNITHVNVQNRTGDVTVCYQGDREEIIKMIKTFSYENVEVPKIFLENSGRELNEKYKEKLINKVVLRYSSKLFIPYPIRAAISVVKSTKYIKHGIQTLLKGKIEVPVLDATAITVSMLRGDMETAGSVMFLLGIGEILEEWTHKKSVDDLARSMSLNIDKVWLVGSDGKEILVDSNKIKAGDKVIVHMGNVIPFDGTVTDGEAMVNQASMTGESLPVQKEKDSSVYAGTVVEEGEILVRVKQDANTTKLRSIVNLVETADSLKSEGQSRMEKMADRIVPWNFLLAGIVALTTRSLVKTSAALMVDYSCALKLTGSLAVMTAMSNAARAGMMVKGAKYFEAFAKADTIVFDKTGTLTEATPELATVLTTDGWSEDEVLRLAACLEEHFPHPVARAVVRGAEERDLKHRERHAEVEYIVAHGLVSSLEGKRVLIGSAHFVIDDEGAHIPEDALARVQGKMQGLSPLYLAVDGEIVGVLGVHDPLKPNVAEVITELKDMGIKHVVMLTGDTYKTAERIAQEAGIDEFGADLLPEDKYEYLKKLKAEGRTIAMVGDGINDSPALNLADVGLAMARLRYCERSSRYRSF